MDMDMIVILYDLWTLVVPTFTFVLIAATGRTFRYTFLFLNISTPTDRKSVV